MELYRFNPVIYPYMLWIAIDKSPSELATHFDEYTGKPIQFIETDTCRIEALAMPVIHKVSKDYGVIIFLRSRKSITFKLAAHESTHAAKYLFEHIGCDVSVHEPLEYVVGWIADCIYKVKTNKVEPTKTV